jgi:hypothetical protein
MSMLYFMPKQLKKPGAEQDIGRLVLQYSSQAAKNVMRIGCFGIGLTDQIAEWCSLCSRGIFLEKGHQKIGCCSACLQICEAGDSVGFPFSCFSQGTAHGPGTSTAINGNPEQ